MAAAQMKKTLESLSEGDRVAITTKKYGRRELTVLGDPQKMGTGTIYVGVTSGKPWGDRKIRGGALTYHDWDPPVVRFQPTMNQSTETVMSLEKIGVSHNNPTWSPGDVVQTTAKFEKAMARAGARPVKRRGVVVYAEAGSPFVFVVEDDGRAGYMKADALEPQRSARKVSAGEIAELKREHARAIAGEENPRGRGRQKNSHDVSKSQRDAASALVRAESDLLAANDALEKGDVEGSVKQLMLASFFLGVAQTHDQYAQGSMAAGDRARLDELRGYLKGGTWARSLAGAMPNPKHRRIDRIAAKKGRRTSRR